MFRAAPTRDRQLDPPRNPPLDADTVRPFGRGGAGLITEHPVGSVVAIGVVLITLIALPPARVFFLGALILGGIFGLVLRLIHR